MKENINLEHPIDVVILWVDGNDPLHQEKMKPFLSKDHEFKDKDFRTRFDQVEEIEYSIKSIIKFAPFVRKIFLVTDNQTPHFLKKEVRGEKLEKVEIVDHQEIFKGFERFLPVFNSISIETMIFKIPHLAEHFIYFNDDMFLINETDPTDFFNNELPVLRGNWSKFDADKIHKQVYNKALKLFVKGNNKDKMGYKKAQQNIAQILGFKKYFRLDHTPVAMRKSTIENYFAQNPNMIIHNLKYRFRHSSYYMIQSLANHLEIKNNTKIMKLDYQLLYFGSYNKPIIWYKFQVWLNNWNKNKLFLCLQSLDQCPKNKLNFFANWLSEKVEDKVTI